MSDDTPSQDLTPYFSMFVEVGIINQIGSAFLEARLPKGLLVSHFGVTSHLSRGFDGATPLELARSFQVAKTTMTHTLSGLEKHGFVELRPNPDDGRSKRVWLTPEGRQFRDDAVQQLEPLFQKLAERFPPEQVSALLPGISEFRAVIDQLRDEEK
ncbi:MarR family winged helix-turn-helix transcriptional regulator [Pseudovibrio sp. Ad26]|uniref:MarR family winged helix-turn-helix transcriptional regulator n=1 Tax=Pseudovibrio sp. Ad26 TaxID=989410 RepID=UPI0007AE6F58|nr:MarR family winged helix-turn-helix transcriptional regulator [Pseudovibrio sp. Ad26]KZK98404.1 DNA-binding transcriptional repressor MarR [Pseudovibrio sp. Ad26]